jgi:hypothetical protein
MQGVVRMIVHEDSLEIYHSKVNEIFPEKVMISDDLTIAEKFKFIRSNEEYIGKLMKSSTRLIECSRIVH